MFTLGLVCVARVRMALAKLTFWKGTFRRWRWRRNGKASCVEFSAHARQFRAHKVIALTSARPPPEPAMGLRAYSLTYDVPYEFWLFLEPLHLLSSY